ncbi:hypothetical protein AOLI_G00012420 [Acnodon oligacanthus]
MSSELEERRSFKEGNGKWRPTDLHGAQILPTDLNDRLPASRLNPPASDSSRSALTAQSRFFGQCHIKHGQLRLSTDQTVSRQQE